LKNSKKYNLIFAFIIIIIVIIISSCNPARRLPSNEYLLNKNKIILDNKNLDSYQISTIIKHRPNKRILDLFRTPLHTYVLFDSKKENGFKRWIKKNLGEPPVILDTILVKNSCNEIKLYLFNKGYFNAIVDAEYKTKNKKTNVIYKIQTDIPYRIKEYNIDIKDTTINKLYQNDSSNYLIKIGDIFDVYKLNSERDRITTNLKNYGYFNFAKEFINFSIDTSFNSNSLKIDLVVQNILNKTKEDSIYFTEHKRYKIQNIHLNSEYNPLNISPTFSDTVIAYYSIDSLGSYKVLYNNKLMFKLSTLKQSTFFKSGEFYNLKQINRTYSRFNELENFNYVSISFSEINDSIYKDSNFKFLDCKIQLTVKEPNSLFYELTGNNIGGNLGLNITIGATRRNVFKGAELLNTRLSFSYEAQEINIQSEEKNKFFNTIEINPNIELIIPNFIIPFYDENKLKSIRPKTRYNLGYNYQQRPDYNRTIVNASYGYFWNINSNQQHFLNILTLNSVKINPDSSFIAILANFNRRIKEQYTNHIIISTKYNYIYDNNLTKSDNTILMKIGLETVGNTLNAIMTLSNANKNSNNQYEIFGIPYANFVLGDIDLRYYKKIHKKSAFVSRISLGIGIPLLNSYSLPFEKSFFLGGANSMRGWSMRGLGPGSYNNITDFERIGDLKFETNYEIRFPIWDYIRSAFFIDAGNIWLLRKNSSLPNGEIKSDRFYKEIAIDTGTGLRLDFSYFIVRFDLAFQIYDPALEENQRWTLDKLSSKNYSLKFGIGYPF